MSVDRARRDDRWAVTWDEQVQAAVDCYEAGASLLHIHVRDPDTGKISKNFQEYADQIGRLREAVPDMVLQVGGSISFAPEGDEVAHWQAYDTRHILAEIDPKRPIGAPTAVPPFMSTESAGIGPFGRHEHRSPVAVSPTSSACVARNDRNGPKRA